MKLHRSFIALILILVVLNPLPVSAQEKTPPIPRLVKDIASCTLNSSPSHFFKANDVVYFSADSALNGKELWRTDGTERGTKLVHDIAANDTSSDPHGFFLSGTNMYFLTKNTMPDDALWVLDTTNDEIKLLQSFSAYAAQYPQGFSVSGFTQAGSLVYFLIQPWVYDLSYHPELWKTDGTASGTAKITSFQIQQSPASLAFFNGWLYFSGWDATNGSELWRSDGTEAGTTLFKDLQVGGDARPHQFTVVGDTLYFATQPSPSTGYSGALWMSNGTPEGTILVDGLPPTSGETELAFVNGGLYFAGDEDQLSTNAAHPFELWRLEITLPAGSPGTNQRLNVNANTGSFPKQFLVVGNLLYFTADDGVNGNEVWRSDGTAAGTFRLSDSALGGMQSPTFLDHSNQKVLFYSDRFWVTDGTTEGTLELVDLKNYGANLSGVVTDLGKIISSGFVPCMGEELLITDANSASTQLLKDIQTVTESTYPFAVFEYAGKAFFMNSDPNHYLELWSTDGTEAGTAKVYHFDLKYSGMLSFSFQSANGLLFFTIKELSEHRASLWRTNGTTSGTRIIDSVTIDAYWENKPFDPVVYKNRIYFLSGSELSSTDGMGTRAEVVKGFSEYIYFLGPVVMNGNLYFTVSGKDGYQLWRSDGTPEGTQLVKAMTEGPISATNWRFNLASAGNSVFFVGNDETHGEELWESDGTTAGTHMVTDLTPGTASSTYNSHLDVSGTLFFTAIGDLTYALWKTGGKFGDVQKVTEQTSSYLLGTDGEKVYYTAKVNDVFYLCRSDGTLVGTKTLFPVNIEWEVHLVFVGKTMFYAYSDAAHGSEIYVFYGNTEKSELLADFIPGPNSSYSYPLGFSAGKLWIMGNDGTHGNELWVYDFLSEHVYIPWFNRN